MTRPAGTPDHSSPDTDILQSVAARLKTLGVPGSPETDAPQVLDVPAAYSAFCKKMDQGKGFSRISLRKGLQEMTRADSKWKTPRFAIGSSNWRKWSVVGAGIGACLLVALVARYASRLFPADLVQQAAYETAPAQRASFTLADGSRVTLAPASRIRVTGRTVDLTGEAVFTVTQNTGIPFIVRAAGVETRVLGTTFGVRAYDGIRVAVAEGRVSVSNTILTAGDVATVIGGVPSVAHNANVSSTLAWTTGRLEFRDTPIAEALTQLSRWYGIHMTAESRFKGLQVTGALDNASAETAIEFMSILLNARTERTGSGITFVER